MYRFISTTVKCGRFYSLFWSGKKLAVGYKYFSHSIHVSTINSFSNDFIIFRYYNCSSIARSACSVPFSCCLPEEGVVNYQCGFNVLSPSDDAMKEVIYTYGCADAMRDWFITNAIILGCCVGALILFQCVTICLGRSLISDIQEVKSYW